MARKETQGFLFVPLLGSLYQAPEHLVDGIKDWDSICEHWSWEILKSNFEALHMTVMHVLNDMTLHIVCKKPLLI